jgi:plastocyanin
MKIPGILIAGVLIAAGLFAPPLSRPEPAPAGTVGMEHEKFAGPDTVTIPRGGSVTFFNSSGWLHLIGPGDKGQFTSNPDVPHLGDLGVFNSETDDTFVAGPWAKTGTYHITCQLHPRMNLTVVVTE